MISCYNLLVEGKTQNGKFPFVVHLKKELTLGFLL